MSGNNQISAFPMSDNIFKWIGTISGSKGTPYDNLSFKLLIEFPYNYPYQPPTIRFTTPCFHPNVDEQGNICLDILKDKWSPVMNIRTTLISIQSLLGEPNIDDPLNSMAANLWGKKKQFKSVVIKKYKLAKENS